jgi:urea transport system permease protein
MVWSGRSELPFFWRPFSSPVFAITMVVVLPATLAALIGYVVFRSRIQGVYFSLITQALTLIGSILLIGQQPVTGGTNGLTDLRTIFGFSLAEGSTQTALYLATVLALLCAYSLCLWITRSRLGRLLIALRDDENRLRFLGYDPVVLKTLVFALSAGVAGVAGALFVAQVGIISPSIMGVVPSVEMVIWVAVGGRGTLAGAIVGALLVNWGKSTFSTIFPDSWQYVLGALFISSVLLFPTGLAGSLSGLVGRARRRLMPAAMYRVRGAAQEPRAPAPLDPGVEYAGRQERSA